MIYLKNGFVQILCFKSSESISQTHCYFDVNGFGVLVVRVPPVSTGDITGNKTKTYLVWVLCGAKWKIRTPLLWFTQAVNSRKRWKYLSFRFSPHSIVLWRVRTNCCHDLNHNWYWLNAVQSVFSGQVDFPAPGKRASLHRFVCPKLWKWVLYFFPYFFWVLIKVNTIKFM